LPQLLSFIFQEIISDLKQCSFCLFSPAASRVRLPFFSVFVARGQPCAFTILLRFLLPADSRVRLPFFSVFVARGQPCAFAILLRFLLPADSRVRLPFFSVFFVAGPEIGSRSAALLPLYQNF
jgi:hypothetical protein